MRNFLSILFISTLLVFTSCSHYQELQTQRAPAQVENEILTSIFSFPITEVKEAAAIPPTTDPAALYQYIPSDDLPSGTAYLVEPATDPANTKNIYKIFYNPKIKNSNEMLNTAMYFIMQLVQIQTEFQEIYYNAKAGDLRALKFLLEKRQTANINILKHKDFEKIIDDFEVTKDELKKEIKNFKANQKLATQNRKLALESLDKAPEQQQFRNLIAKGDRKGAVELLKKYLPWEQMAPFEKRFWNEALSIIEKPVPLDQRVLIYRGLNEDYINRAFVKGEKELSEKEAIAQGKAFIMSSVMIKNQGSWNRRLRSLEAMYDKQITLGFSPETKDKAEVSRITSIFENHAGDPMGSPFISFTPDLKIAHTFGLERVSSYLIDPRLLNFNYASVFSNEVEYLIPLMTFPDELIGITNSSDDLIKKEAELNEKLQARIAEEFGEGKSEDVINKIKKNSYSFFKSKFKEMPDVQGANPGQDNIKFYKNFLNKNDVTPALTPKGELACKDLITKFWAAK